MKNAEEGYSVREKEQHQCCVHTGDGVCYYADMHEVVITPDVEDVDVNVKVASGVVVVYDERRCR